MKWALTQPTRIGLGLTLGLTTKTFEFKSIQLKKSVDMTLKYRYIINTSIKNKEKKIKISCEQNFHILIISKLCKTRIIFLRYITDISIIDPNNTF